MADFTLIAHSPLGGYDHDFSGTRLMERTSLAVVALAVPQGEDAAAPLRRGYSAEFPSPRVSTLSSDGSVRFLLSAPDQVFVLFAHDGPDAEAAVEKRAGGTVYLTDQSDAFAALELSGPLAKAALERICMLDLHDSAFPVGAYARTVMEHLGVFLIREADDRWLLLSARSSGGSFLHAV